MGRMPEIPGIHLRDRHTNICGLTKTIHRTCHWQAVLENAKSMLPKRCTKREQNLQLACPSPIWVRITECGEAGNDMELHGAFVALSNTRVDSPIRRPVAQ